MTDTDSKLKDVLQISLNNSMKFDCSLDYEQQILRANRVVVEREPGDGYNVLMRRKIAAGDVMSYKKRVAKVKKDYENYNGVAYGLFTIPHKDYPNGRLNILSEITRCAFQPKKRKEK
jgi:hypothetical protein